MTTQRDLKKHFEAIVGRELEGGFGDEVALRETIGLYSSEQGNATSREIGVTGSSAKGCGQALLLTVAGLSFVGQGKAELHLSDYHCARVGFRHPVIVVATPRTPSPVFVTAVPTIIDGGRDVEIVLHAWGPDGSPAPNVLVTWLCRVQSLPVID